MPAVTHDQWAALPAALQAVATQVAFLGSYDANRVQLSPVGAAPEQFERYWAFLNYPHISALGRNGLRTTVQGWYRDSASTQWPSFAVKAAGGEAVAYTLKRLPSPDLQKYFAEQRLSWNRFDISYSCPNICSITALAFKRPDLELKIDRDSNFLASSGTATIYVDKVIHDWQATSGFNAAEKLAGHVRSGLVRIYQVAIPLLLAAGLLALIAAYDGAIATRKVPAVLLAATAAWVLVATRIVLLALIDVSSFPATSFSYSAPAAYLAVVAAILSIAAVLVQLPQAPRSRSQAAGGIR